MKKMNFHEMKGGKNGSSCVHIYIYIGAERFSKSCIAQKQGEAKFENIIVGRRDVLSRTKGVDEGGRVEGQCILSGGIFTEWEHELAA